MDAVRELRSSVANTMSGRVGELVARLGCHQIPERCFHYRGSPMPVCARCFGVAVGQLIAAITVLANTSLPVFACVAGPIVMLADWGAQQYLHKMSTNVRRVATGLLAGLGLGTFYCIAIRWLVHLVL